MEKTPDEEIVDVFSKTEDDEIKVNKTVQPTTQKEQPACSGQAKTPLRPTQKLSSPIKPNPVKDEPKTVNTPSPSPPPTDKPRPSRRKGRSPLPTYYRERVFNQKAPKKVSPCKAPCRHVHNPVGEKRGSQVYRRLHRLKQWEVNLILELDPIDTWEPNSS